ncbi:triose-phosphate isomerase family protein [Pseudonocardia sp. ICBG1293]|uniref:triose-phosphate isomerase family protein n=1 Tax=Pseudonocardia sp. ICBG1293 TaxID=2844382 RepID=UPI001CCD4F12|nr:triose-phosphate isomerase family protein [Pseudonocardia sp. ICBG1293]
MLIGTSFKTYFSHARTCSWLREVAALAVRHPAVASGTAALFALPQFPSIPESVRIARPAGIAVGAQTLAVHDEGPWTGEVSGAVLAELGATLAEVGHAERRTHFGETDDVVAAKTHAALRNGLTPVLCGGESGHTGPGRAADVVRAQVDHALAPARAAGHEGAVVVAYEPVWAIGAPAPAPVEHVRRVGSALRAHVGEVAGSAVLYGGSAGPGLLPRIADGVDGLFLGRFAHDPRAVALILDEVAALEGAR